MSKEQQQRSSRFLSSSGYSKEFCDADATWRTDNSLQIEEVETEDIYEMALEVLEADEAFRLESSGSISPESDVDRLLENADTERFSGDVTLVRIFSIRQDDDRSSLSDINLDLRESSEVRSSKFKDRDEHRSHAFDSILNESLQSETEEQRNTFRTPQNDLNKAKSEPSISKCRASSDELDLRRAFDSTDFVSVDLNSDTHSVESDVCIRPNWKTSNGGSFVDPNCDSQLICTAKFSNVTSKDARIRTALTFNNSVQETDDGLGDRTESDISLHLTSSDSLYSTTDDCFGDSAFVNSSSKYYGALAFPSSDDHLNEFPAFAFREPSPEELFDEALETRSDLAASICSSSQMSPQCVFYDALHCSTRCVHRGPSPEDAFDLALEMLSDAVDDSSSSVFIIAPRRGDHHRQRGSADADPLLNEYIESNATLNKMADAITNGRSSSADVSIREIERSPLGSRGSSCEVVLDDQPSHVDRLLGFNIGESSDPFTADDCSEEFDSAKGERRRVFLDPWSSDCPSSPEPSFLAEYSTDDCIGESEGDESLTDYEASSSGIDPMSKNNFFHRLLRRRQIHETLNHWTDDEAREDLDKIQICSIEDLLTDSENEKDFRNGKTIAARSVHECSQIFPLLHAKGSIFLQPCLGDEHGPQTNLPEYPHSAEEVGVSLSPPIALAVRADIQYARKSKIPKLPESRAALSSVRISW